MDVIVYYILRTYLQMTKIHVQGYQKYFEPCLIVLSLVLFTIETKPPIFNLERRVISQYNKVSLFFYKMISDGVFCYKGINFYTYHSACMQRRQIIVSTVKKIESM